MLSGRARRTSRARFAVVVAVAVAVVVVGSATWAAPDADALPYRRGWSWVRYLDGGRGFRPPPRVAPAPPRRVAPAPPRPGPAAAPSPSASPAPSPQAGQGEAGVYRVTVEVRGASGRARIAVQGARVAEVDTTSSWRRVTVPVHLPAPDPGLVAVTSAREGRAVEGRVVAIERGSAGLTTRGNSILDPAGRRVVLRGVQRTGMSEVATGFNMSDRDIDWIAKWGAGIVRLELSHHFWLADSCAYDPAYAARVDDAVASITSRGMVALLDLHRSTQDKPCRAARLYKMADRRAVPFWRAVADRYKSNPLVAFDLFNEPHDITAEMWRDGGAIDGWETAGMQELYDTVRATGAENLVFVSGLGWATYPTVHLTHPLDGYGIVVGVHLYRPPPTGAVLPAAAAWVPAVAAQYPVVVTEFGAPEASGAFNANVIAFAEDAGVGWVAFAWVPWGAEAFGLFRSWETYEPNVAGRPVRDALWRARGWTTYGGT